MKPTLYMRLSQLFGLLAIGSIIGRAATGWETPSFAVAVVTGILYVAGLVLLVIAFVMRREDRQTYAYKLGDLWWVTGLLALSISTFVGGFWDILLLVVWVLLFGLQSWIAYRAKESLDRRGIVGDARLDALT